MKKLKILHFDHWYVAKWNFSASMQSCNTMKLPLTVCSCYPIGSRKVMKKYRREQMMLDVD
ncbi:MAG: hypothetical protein QF755_03055 [Candidatus Peribacteraceae bacterium]|nr:hypothetical protein [Candidatus Peribacteraceae bacterium]